MSPQEMADKCEGNVDQVTREIMQKLPPGYIGAESVDLMMGMMLMFTANAPRMKFTPLEKGALMELGERRIMRTLHKGLDPLIATLEDLAALANTEFPEEKPHAVDPEGHESCTGDSCR